MKIVTRSGRKIHFKKLASAVILGVVLVASLPHLRMRTTEAVTVEEGVTVGGEIIVIGITALMDLVSSMRRLSFTRRHRNHRVST